MTRARDLAKGTFSGDLTVDTNTLVVDSANNSVGIGISSPAYRVDVGTSSVAGNIHTFGSITSGTLAGYSIRTIPRLTNDTGTFENTYIGCGATVGNIIFQQGNSFTTASNTERMRLNSSGNLLVGTTTVGLQNNMSCGFIGLDTTSYAVINHTSGTGGGNYYAAFGYNGSAIGSITQNGTTGVSYNTSSDYRLKTDAQPMVGASDRVLALKPVNFEWISDGSRVDGFLAHEAQAVVPECVTGTKDAMRDEEYEVTAAVLDADGRVVTEAVMGTRSVPDMQGIDQSKLVPLLTAALQEALNKIEAMETRLAALEAN
jgi:hypothetical protein